MTQDKRERTPWFPGHIAPARPGIYEREFPNIPMYAMWNGKRWLVADGTVGRARYYGVQSLHQLEVGSLRWRGLAQEPKN